MEFKELQGKMTAALWEYGQRNSIRVDDDYVLMKLFEEVGDVSKAVLLYKDKCEKRKEISKEEAKKKIADEVADSVGLLLSFASQLNIDVEEIMVKKWLSEESESLS